MPNFFIKMKSENKKMYDENFILFFRPLFLFVLKTKKTNKKKKLMVL